METACFSETLVFTYESIRRQNPEKQHRQVRVQVLTAVSVAMLMDVVRTSETSVYTYFKEITRRYIPEGCHLRRSQD
jgi:hypothetical protein